MKRVGISEVAEAAGVSVTTVSHALSGQRRVSEDTRTRVAQVAAELGYAPNRIARALRSRRTGVIGFVSDEIATTPFAGRIVLGAQEAAAELGVLLMVVNSNRDAEVEARQIRLLLAQQVDGVLYATMYHQDVTVPPMLATGPVVLINATDPASGASSVVPDEIRLGAAATTRLLDAGHRRVAHLTIAESRPGSDGRREGFERTARAAGVEPLVIAVPPPGDPRAGRAALAEALTVCPDLTAVFCFNDRMAMGVYQEAQARGLSLPADLSVISVDNLELIAAELRPALTTVALPHYEMGRWGVQELLRLIADPGAEREQLRLECEVVERDSVGVRQPV